MSAAAVPAAPTQVPSRKALAFELVAASFIVLFQELLLIRWLPGQVRVVGYFPNLVLISAFLGLGLGCLRAGRRSLLWLWPSSLAAIVAVAAALSRIVFTDQGTSEHLFLLYYDLPRSAPVLGDIRPPLLAIFVLCALSFAPLGQLVAERLRRFGEMGDPLAGYAWDIGGSILGIAAFTLLSFRGTFPVAWITVVLVAGGLYFRERPARLAIYGALAATIAAGVALTEKADRYTPYYALSVRPGPGPAVTVLTNGSLHQYAMPVGAASDPRDGQSMARIRQGYHLPYRYLARPPRRALVIGSGTGNDVAVLLAEGAERVDAVEIDPAILEAGRRVHPDRPYDSPRVRTVNTDARTFLNNTGERYDLVVFGTLDSMTRLSALSSVRLDNFVYTLESLRAARRVLTPEGGLVLYFMVPNELIHLRLGGMLAEVFGEAPLVTTDYYTVFNRVYMAGPAFAGTGGTERRAGAADVLATVRARTELPSDDWPYLYVTRRGITPFYATMAALIFLLALAGTAVAAPQIVRRLGTERPDWEMFWLGAGFLLLETAAVTEMNLVWGATWLTSAVVFLCVLATVLAAALVVRRFRLRYGLAVGAMAVSVIAFYAAPAELALRADAGGRLGVSLVLVGVPIFFGSICFSRAYAVRPAPDRAFGWNILGAVAGGLAEMASMAVGLRSLLLLALAAYLAAYLLARRSAAGALA